MAGVRAMFSAWTRLRAWVLHSSHLVLLTGGLSALVALAAVGALALNDFRAANIGHQNHAAMLARVLEDQATRTMQTTELALESLATLPALTAVVSDPRRMQDTLGQALAALPFLRGLAVVDAGGRVVVSTLPGDTESFVDLAKLGSPVVVGRTVQGGFTPGRSLQSVRLGGPAVATPAGVAFIPILHGYKSEAGHLLVLVALVNPDSLSNFQHLTLESYHFAFNKLDKIFIHATPGVVDEGSDHWRQGNRCSACRATQASQLACPIPAHPMRFNSRHPGQFGR